MSEPTDPKTEIRNALAALRARLGAFMQTTHGSLAFDGPTIKGVAVAMVNAYQNPTAYNVSELDQIIRAFLRREDDDRRRAQNPDVCPCLRGTLDSEANQRA